MEPTRIGGHLARRPRLLVFLQVGGHFDLHRRIPQTRGAHNTVAGDEQRQRVPTHGLSHRATGFGGTGRLGQLTVGSGFPPRDLSTSPAYPAGEIFTFGSHGSTLTGNPVHHRSMANTSLGEGCRPRVLEWGVVPNSHQVLMSPSAPWSRMGW